MILAAILAASSVPAEGSAATVADEQSKDWTLNLKDVDIRAFLEQVSSITGENFVIDPQVKGTVSVVATRPMGKSAVNELLQTVLRVNGYVAVPSGGVVRIVPQANAKLETDASGSQRIVTRVIPVRQGDVEEAAKILKPLVSQAGYLEGSVNSNAVIVSDYADNVAQMAKTLESLDKQDESDVDVIPLKEGWVGNIAPLLEAMGPPQGGEGGKGRNRLRVVADERSNSIVVRGDAKEREQIRTLVEKFDHKTQQSGDIQWIPLRFADATQVAALLRGMVMSNAAQTGPAAANPNSGNPLAPASRSAAMAGLFGATATPPAGASPGATADNPDAGIVAGTFIQADVPMNALVVGGSPSMISGIRALVAQLDVRRPQVLIEAAIVEVSMDKSEQLGVQYAAGSSAQTAGAGTTQFSGNELSLGSVLTALGNANAAATTGEGVAIALGTKSRFEVLVQALASTAGANLLSTPSVTTLDNEEAKIVVGQNVPFRTGDFTTLSSGVTNPFTTIERQDIGITLKVLPQIHEGNLVRLTIDQEVSSISNTVVAGAADLITNKRTIQTNVLAEDGETVVLGGLMEDDASDSTGAVPVLGSIPVLGALFRNSSHDVSKRNLLVFLRPTVLRGREQMAAVTQERYNRVYDLQIGRTFMGDEGHALPPAGAPVVLPWLASTAATPAAQTVFDPPPKKLPWLLP